MEKEKPIGALWEKSGNKGKFMSGSLELDGKVIRIVCFTNSYKKEAKHPDWKIYFSRERTEQRDNQAELNNMGPKTPTEEVDPNEIPF